MRVFHGLIAGLAPVLASLFVASAPAEASVLYAFYNDQGTVAAFVTPTLVTSAGFARAADLVLAETEINYSITRASYALDRTRNGTAIDSFGLSFVSNDKPGSGFGIAADFADQSLSTPGFHRSATTGSLQGNLFVLDIGDRTATSTCMSMRSARSRRSPLRAC